MLHFLNIEQTWTHGQPAGIHAGVVADDVGVDHRLKVVMAVLVADAGGVEDLGYFLYLFRGSMARLIVDDAERRLTVVLAADLV